MKLTLVTKLTLSNPRLYALCVTFDQHCTDRNMVMLVFMGILFVFIRVVFIDVSLIAFTSIALVRVLHVTGLCSPLWPCVALSGFARASNFTAD